ncbi:MAG: AAA family ATPase [Planctomycetaceae bacterium]
MKQQDVTITREFQRCIDDVENGANVFITGRAGTGKSTLLRLICQQQKRRQLAVVAPTGVAALNVDGATIHSYFAFRPGLAAELTKYRPPNHLRALEMLVIDEVSMAKADLVDMVDVALRRAKKNQLPFGGVQLVFVGDLFQLPPVEGREDGAEQYYATPYFFSSRAFDRASLMTVELSTIFRQKDEQFIAILNSIRDGSVTEPQIEALNCRYVPGFAASEECGGITLAARNDAVNEINERQLAILPGESTQYAATTHGEVEKKKFQGLEMLRLKLDAQVMMLVNQHGYVNGSLGRIVSLSDNLISVHIADLDSPVDVERYTWKVFDRTKRNEHHEKLEIGSFSQFPLKLAWAVTVHKSQGKTFDNVIFDPRHSSQPGQTYVALSRCTSLEGITLTQPIKIGHVKVSPHVVRFHRTIGIKKCPIDTFNKAFVGIVVTGTDQYRKLAEVAIIRHDREGQVASCSTMVNPNRDLCEATGSRLAASDMTLCPDISEARSITATMLSGCVPIGFQVSDLFSLSGWSAEDADECVPLNLRINAIDELEGEGRLPKNFACMSAMERAEFARDVFNAKPEDERNRILAAPFVLKKNEIDVGSFFLARNADTLSPDVLSGEILRSLDSKSKCNFIVGCSVGDCSEVHRSNIGKAIKHFELSEAYCAESAMVLRQMLVEKAERDQEVTQSEADQICAFIKFWKLACDPPRPQSNRKLIELLPGMRVCLTGKSVSSDHPCYGWSKNFVVEKAEPHGLIFLDDVRKGDAPDVVALLDISQESAKANKARKWGIPVLTWTDIVDWATIRAGKCATGG